MTGLLASIAVRNLARHGKRTIITAGVLTVGIGMFIFFDALLAGMDRMTIDSISNTQMIPGTMKFTLRISGLNQTRGSRLTTGCCASATGRPWSANWTSTACVRVIC